MDKNIFLQKFEEQFQDTEPGSIQLDTKFKDLPEWSSLVALCLIAMIDESYSKTISGDDFGKVETVNEFLTLVENK